MNAQTDPQLLRAYAERRSEAAFAELVRRHIDLVHSAAFRMVSDPDLAKDVSQGVFVALAKDAGKLTAHPVLSGWLHRTARNIAAQTIRTEVRRRNREHQAAVMNEHPETDASWEEIAPHLDAALADLSEPDRDVVLLRYFENKPAQEMAALLGITAEAAQKRVSRAVERLRENFAKRGLTSGATGLTGILSANAVQAAPAGLAATLSAAALTGTSATLQILAMTTLQKSLAATALTLLAGVIIYQTTKPPRLGQASQQSPQNQKQLTTRSQEISTHNTSGLKRNNERVVRKNSELKEQNATLTKEKAQAEMQLKKVSYQTEIMMKAIENAFKAGDSIDPKPKSIPEVALLFGRVKIEGQNFDDKWNGKIPAQDSPDRAIYLKDKEAVFSIEVDLIRELATLGDDWQKDHMNLAQFQSAQLSAALGLDESQSAQLNDSMNHFVTEMYRRKLDKDSRPPAGEDAYWLEGREKMTNEFYGATQSHFTPQQRLTFQKIYKPDFLWGFGFGIHTTSQ